MIDYCPKNWFKIVIRYKLVVRCISFNIYLAYYNRAIIQNITGISVFLKILVKHSKNEKQTILSKLKDF